MITPWKIRTIIMMKPRNLAGGAHFGMYTCVGVEYVHDVFHAVAYSLSKWYTLAAKNLLLWFYGFEHNDSITRHDFIFIFFYFAVALAFTLVCFCIASIVSHIPFYSHSFCKSNWKRNSHILYPLLFVSRCKCVAFDTHENTDKVRKVKRVIITWFWNWRVEHLFFC